VQQENKVLAAVNFSLGLGDKHIHIDKLRDGKFRAGDLRLRFEFGNTQLPEKLELPGGLGVPVHISTEGLRLTVLLFDAAFDDYKGYWQKGTDGKTSWIDYVFYSGDAKEFSLPALKKAVAAFCLQIDRAKNAVDMQPPAVQYMGPVLQAAWSGMNLEVNTDVRPVRKHGAWY
jgi:hypothetical protein